MDNIINNNHNENTLFKSTPQPTPPPPITPSPQVRIFNYLRTHKKITLIIFIVLLVTCLVLLNFNNIKQRFFKNSNPNSTTTEKPQTPTTSIMEINSPKVIYSKEETIPISVIASSAGANVTGFDTVIEYDPEFLNISKRNPPPLSDFLYYGKNTNNLISVSAVRKPNANTVETFTNTTLFDLEFTAKKAGKTVLKLIYMPNSVSDSNIINSDSKDVLGNARGLEITIN